MRIMPAIPNVGINEILYEVVTLPVETPGRSDHLINERMPQNVSNIVRQIPIRKRPKLRASFCVLEQLTDKDARPNVVEVVSPKPFISRLIFLPAGLEHWKQI